MKKITKLVAVLMALLIVLCGCAKKTDDGQFNYSKGITKDGFWEGIKATDYVKLCDLTNIEIAQSEIDEEIDYLLDAYKKTIENKTRAVVDKDTVNIDYVGSIDGVEFDGGSTKGSGTSVTIGVTSYIDNFLEQLIGHKPGETFDINVTFPDPYPNNPDLAGKPAVFKTTINYVEDYEKSVLGDEFVKENLKDQYGWETVEDMKAGIKGSLVQDYIFEHSEFTKPYPEIIKTQYVDRMVYEAEQNAKYYGLDVNTYISYIYGYYGMTTLEDLQKYFEINADNAAESYLLYQAVAETKGFKMPLSDLNKYYKKQSISDSQVDAMLDTYGKPFVTAMALYDKVVDYFNTLGTVK